MSEEVKCDGCGTHGRRKRGRICPDGWRYAAIPDSNNPDSEFYVLACCSACESKAVAFKDGPGLLTPMHFSSDEIDIANECERLSYQVDKQRDQIKTLKRQRNMWRDKCAVLKASNAAAQES